MGRFAHPAIDNTRNNPDAIEWVVFIPTSAGVFGVPILALADGFSKIELAHRLDRISGYRAAVQEIDPHPLIP